MREHPAPWWYRLAQRLFPGRESSDVPGRCREIPEAQDPSRILLRQVAIVSRRVYLQQFASGEGPDMHAHEGPVLVLGLWGSYREQRLVGTERRVQAPYAYVMGRDVVHRVDRPSPGHTSIFVILRRERERQYMRAGSMWSWREQVKQEVKRI
jgi:hypothetical protein